MTGGINVMAGIRHDVSEGIYSPEIGPQVLSINQLDILYTYIHIDRKRCIIGAAASISVVLQLIIAAPSSLNISLLNISLLNISLMLLSVWITLFTRSH